MWDCDIGFAFSFEGLVLVSIFGPEAGSFLHALDGLAAGMLWLSVGVKVARCERLQFGSEVKGRGIRWCRRVELVSQ